MLRGQLRDLFEYKKYGRREERKAESENVSRNFTKKLHEIDFICSFGPFSFVFHREVMHFMGIAEAPIWQTPRSGYVSSGTLFKRQRSLAMNKKMIIIFSQCPRTGQCPRNGQGPAYSSVHLIENQANDWKLHRQHI